MQSSRALHALPVLLCLASAPPLFAQTRYRVVNDGEPFHQEPGGRQLARLARGAIVTGADPQDEWLRVTIEGWIFAASIGPAARPGFDLAVIRDPDENLRTAPDGALVAKLVQGFQLMRVSEEQERWVRVRREGWVKRDGLAPAAVATRARADTAAGAGGLTPG
ncbi:MAG: SH3 domain-containing protein, partial [Gemmatimonadales bacterium]